MPSLASNPPWVAFCPEVSRRNCHEQVAVGLHDQTTSFRREDGHRTSQGRRLYPPRRWLGMVG